MRFRSRSKPSGEATPKDVYRELRSAEVASAWTDVTLRRFIGYGAVFVTAIQIAIADYLFFLYGHSNAWEIPVGGIQAWLAATVIQVFVIVRMLAQYLFPPDKPTGTAPSDPSSE
jgi:hypothetical protein